VDKADKDFILQSDLAAAELVYPLSCWVIQDGDVVDEANIVFSLTNPANRMQTVEALGAKHGISIRPASQETPDENWAYQTSYDAWSVAFLTYIEAVRHAVMALE